MSVKSKLLAPFRWLLRKESSGESKVEAELNQNSSITPALDQAKQLSESEEILRFTANLKKILIAANPDVGIIFDDAVSLAKKI